MKTKQAFAVQIKKFYLNDREVFENWVVFIALNMTGLLTVVDLISDISEGAGAFHLLGEGLITFLCFTAVFILWRRKLALFQLLQEQKKLVAQAEVRSARALQEANRFKEEANNAIQGLSHAIDLQLTQWHLTAAEKEVALLLLKGLSLKEIATIREVSDKTARAQSFAIYSKSGLSGRAHLSAFFLEDLMVPAHPIEPRVNH